VRAALAELAEIGVSFAALVNDRIKRPAGPVDVGREVLLFARAARLAQKITAFSLWLHAGGQPDAAAIARRQGKPALPPSPPPARVAEAAARKRAEKRDDEGPARDAPPAMTIVEDQVRFNAWFARHTTEEVVLSFKRGLMSLARALDRPEEAARIGALVETIVAATGGAGDLELPVPRRDGSAQPAAKVARGAARARSPKPGAAATEPADSG
jgi:hypothetical protein